MYGNLMPCTSMLNVCGPSKLTRVSSPFLVFGYAAHAFLPRHCLRAASFRLSLTTRMRYLGVRKSRADAERRVGFIYFPVTPTACAKCADAAWPAYCAYPHAEHQ